MPPPTCASIRPTSMRRSIRLAALMLDPERSHAPETARMIDSASAQVLFGAGMMQPRLVGRLGRSRGPAPARADHAERHRCRSLVGHPDVPISTWRSSWPTGATFTRRTRWIAACSSTRAPRRFSEFLDPFLGLALLGVIPESVAATTFAPGVRAWKSVADASLRHRRGNCVAFPGGWPEETRRRWRGSRSAPSRKAERRRAPAASCKVDTSTPPRPRISHWPEPIPPARCGSFSRFRTRSVS